MDKSILGATVGDSVTGVIGKVVSIHHYYNGPTQLGIQPLVKGDNKIPDILFIYEGNPDILFIYEGNVVEVPKN